MKSDDDDFLLLLLSDANLPTGSFVASSGFESHVQHGMPRDPLPFLRHSVKSYAHAALPFARDAHRVLVAFDSDDDEPAALRALEALDALYDACTLNHVARRASRAQGVALLALYTKGLTRPAYAAPPPPHERALAALVDALKLRVRRGATPGHLPVCWGVLTGALALPAGVLPFTFRVGSRRPPRRARGLSAPVPARARPAVGRDPHERPGPVRGATGAVVRRAAAR
jgi:urease accessory protein